MEKRIGNQLATIYHEYTPTKKLTDEIFTQKILDTPLRVNTMQGEKTLKPEELIDIHRKDILCDVCRSDVNKRFIRIVGKIKFDFQFIQ